MVKRGMVIRRISFNECPWLKNGMNAGVVVYEFIGSTFGVISPHGVAVTFDPEGGEPFFEVPGDSVRWVKD